MTRDGETRTFEYDGAERVDDGRFTYEFDRRGRLVKATAKPRDGALTLRRILYEYSPADRIVGRRAEYAHLTPPASSPDEGAWKLEDRAEVLASDALPADVTFVWDPITDRLVTIADRDGSPLRQMIHGDNAYDDPIEVAVRNDRGGVDHLYPIYDEAGAGLLQVVVNDAGDVVSRSVIEGPYGEDEFTLTGPAVDHIAASATRTPDGALEAVSITIRLTEAIAPATVATGVRLATLDSTGTTVQTATVEPTLDGPHTIRWTLTAAEWQSLLAADSATALSIAVTNTLRAAAWSDTIAVLAPPDWSNLHSSATTPVEYRESIATAAGWFAADAPTTLDLFTASALSSLASETALANNIAASSFQALPFAEPVTGLTYARARWLDVDTGTFLTNDPLGYQDSSNQHVFAGGDPVNHNDPTGMYQADIHFGLTYYLALRAGFSRGDARKIADGAEAPDRDPERKPVEISIRAIWAEQLSKGRTRYDRVAGADHVAKMLRASLRRWHFPRGDRDPRIVQPLSQESQQIALAGIVNNNVVGFGEGLHVLQDSVSHRGRPSFLGMSGHPNERGGFLSTDTDVPYKFPREALFAAQVTYTFLRAMKTKNGYGSIAPALWSSIENEVRQFIALQERQDKRDWLARFGIALTSEMWDEVDKGPEEIRRMKDEIRLLQRGCLCTVRF